MKLVTAAVFVAASFVALFYAYGYQYDVRDNGIKKTSIIDVEASYDNVDLSFNGLSVAEKLPFQIKNVDPGLYDVEVKKDGFLPWKRKVKVQQDIVSIVYDVLLYPIDIQKYIKQLLPLDSKLQMVFGPDFIIEYNKGDANLKLIQIKPDFLLNQEDVELYRQGIKNITLVSKDGILVEFDDGIYGFLNVTDRDFKLFALPKGAYNLKVSFDDESLFFMQGQNLFKSTLSDLSLKKPEDINSVELRDNVTDFEPTFRNAVIYVTDGCVYLMNQDNKEEQLFAFRPCNFTDLSFNYEGGYGLLTLREKNGDRVLQLADTNLNFQNISNHVIGNGIVNDSGKIVYVDNEKNLNFYDVVKGTQQFVKKVADGYTLLNWYDGQHFIEQNQDQTYLNDPYDANPYLLPLDKDLQKVFVKNKTIYFVESNSLSGIEWNQKDSLFSFR